MPQITQPVDLIEIPEPEYPAQIEAATIKMPPVPVASYYARLRLRRRRSASAVAAPPPVAAQDQQPEAPATPEIGTLSSGSDTSPRAQREAADLIASNERRLNSLSTQKVEAERVQLSKVRNFQKQAQDALKSGDTEGAKTLATKAKLLLDDIEKL